MRDRRRNRLADDGASPAQKGSDFDDAFEYQRAVAAGVGLREGAAEEGDDFVVGEVGFAGDGGFNIAAQTLVVQRLEIRGATASDLRHGSL